MDIARAAAHGLIHQPIDLIEQRALPGGVGRSGMGRYQGRDGFLEFSNRRAVYRQVRSELIARLRPPYGAALRDMLRGRLKD